MTLRDVERKSIFEFVQRVAKLGYLKGDVLDYGCGMQPYRGLVERYGGQYVGFDRPWFPGYIEGSPSLGPIPEEVWDTYWDAVLCTQVVQYIPLVRYGSDPEGSLQSVLSRMRQNLRVKRGHLVMTYPTNWPEVEELDLHRFTQEGMTRLLTEAGFEIVLHEPRAAFRAWINEWITDEFLVGYGVVAR